MSIEKVKDYFRQYGIEDRIRKTLAILDAFLYNIRILKLLEKEARRL